MKNEWWEDKYFGHFYTINSEKVIQAYLRVNEKSSPKVNGIGFVDTRKSFSKRYMCTSSMKDPINPTNAELLALAVENDISYSILREGVDLLREKYRL